MTGKEQTFFFKRLAFLTNANVPLLEALCVLQEQAGSKRQSKIVGHLVSDVQEGKSLAKAFGKFPRVFGEFCLSIVQVGEASGTLAATLNYLALELKKKQQLRAKVLGAFIYPAVITFATLGITAFLILFLFPKIMPIFKSLHTTLPLSTRMVMVASDFLSRYGILLLICFAALAVAVPFAVQRSRRARLFCDRASLAFPLFGQMLQLYNISNASRTLGLLLASGTNLTEAVSVTADATPNLAYKREFESLCAVVMNGKKISTHLAARTAYFPPVFCHMVAVGERSGTLSETLLYLADLYDNEVDEFTKNISTLIEPVLMVVMGMVVGFIAISIITPLYGITQSLHT